MGSQGTSGSQGTMGSQGTSGSQGIDGSQGTTGSQGIQGFTGSQGVQGFTGSQGIQGPGIVNPLNCRGSVYSNATTTPTTVLSYLNIANTAIIGETYRIFVAGYRTGTNNSSSTIRVNVDGVTALTYTHANSNTAANFMFEAYVTIMSLGATGTAWTQGYGAYNSILLQPASTAATTISTNTNSAIEVTLASGSTANTYFVTTGFIEILRNPDLVF
ncbi:MAG: hypothetical protein ACKODS_06205 [Methylophilaceae bacterium]